MKTNSYLTIPKWGDYQSYKDRPMTWIKLHTALLDDYEFCKLDTVHRYQLMACWLLAARTGNKLPDDPEWLQIKASTSEPFDVEYFIENKWLERLRTTVQTCVRTTVRTSVPRLDKIREDKIRSDKTLIQNEVLDAWNETATELGLIKQPCRLTEKRQTALKERACENKDYVIDFKSALEKLKDIPFLMGEGERGWVATIDFMLRPDSVYKINEGGYGNKTQSISDRPKPSNQFGRIQND